MKARKNSSNGLRNILRRIKCGPPPRPWPKAVRKNWIKSNVWRRRLALQSRWSALNPLDSPRSGFWRLRIWRWGITIPYCQSCTLCWSRTSGWSLPASTVSANRRCWKLWLVKFRPSLEALSLREMWSLAIMNRIWNGIERGRHRWKSLRKLFRSCRRNRRDLPCHAAASRRSMFSSPSPPWAAVSSPG